MVSHTVFALLLATLASPAAAFVVGESSRPTGVTSLASTTTETDDLLKPTYDIEPLSIRIGHGFDIHRMAPVEEAGQPVVIGGVEITHKDQKASPQAHFPFWRVIHSAAAVGS